MIGEAGKNNAPFQLADRFQLFYAHAVHALQQGIPAGQQQSPQRRTRENGTDQMAEAAIEQAFAATNPQSTSSQSTSSTQSAAGSTARSQSTSKSQSSAKSARSTKKSTARK